MLYKRETIEYHTCFYCLKIGHFSKMCHKRKTVGCGKKIETFSTSAQRSTIATISDQVLFSLGKASTTVTINGKDVEALFDSGSLESLVNNPRFFNSARLVTHPCTNYVSMVVVYKRNFGDRPLEGAREQWRLPREAPESANWGAKEHH